MQNSKAVSRNTPRYAKWLTGQRIVVVALLLATLVFSVLNFVRQSHLAAPAVPTATEIAQAVNGPAEFQRPGSMEYVAKTDSCIVGGTVVSATWHVGANKEVGVDAVDWKTVEYTAFVFKSDDGRTFTVSDNDALFLDPGENLGLELDCDRATMTTAKSFGMTAIIWGGK